VSASLPLPRGAHVPGSGTTPDRAPLDTAKALVRPPVREAEWEGNEPYRYGVALCLNGFFWEAHEVWEAVWLACPPNSRERRFLRALIQIANAALKLRMGRANAARRLLAEAAEIIGECLAAQAGARLMGVDLPELRHVLAGAKPERSVEAEEALLRPLRGVAEAGLRRNMHYSAVTDGSAAL
jgi:uncharacterized protein